MSYATHKERDVTHVIRHTDRGTCHMSYATHRERVVQHVILHTKRGT